MGLEAPVWRFDDNRLEEALDPLGAIHSTTRLYSVLCQINDSSCSWDTHKESTLHLSMHRKEQERGKPVRGWPAESANGLWERRGTLKGKCLPFLYVSDICYTNYHTDSKSKSRDSSRGRVSFCETCTLHLSFPACDLCLDVPQNQGIICPYHTTRCLSMSSSAVAMRRTHVYIYPLRRKTQLSCQIRPLRPDRHFGRLICDLLH